MTVYIEAVSLINALGADDETILSNLVAGLSPGMAGPTVRTVDGIDVPFGHAAVTLPETDPSTPRNQRLLRAAWDAKRAQFERLMADMPRDRIAVVMGTSTAASQEFSDWWRAQAKGTEYPPFKGEWQEMGDPARDLAAYLGITGPAMTIATACTSSARALISGARLLESGIVDAVIAGGADTLAEMPLNGFHALGVLAPTLTRPLTEHRPGITIGEGAGIVWMTKTPKVAKPVIFSGWGESSDGYHMSSPEPEGRGAEKAIRGALQKASLSPDAIQYVNLHGTGTGQNDAAELAAMARVFEGRVPMSSTKALTGHTLGAAGITDAGLLILMLMKAQGLTLPAQFGADDTPDPALMMEGVIREQTTLPMGPVMSNNFAFGGNNTSLIFEPSQK